MNKKRNNFTLMEILVTVTILVILMALGAGGISKVLDAQAHRKAVMQIDILESAIESYYDEKGRYPVRFNGRLDDTGTRSDFFIRASDLSPYLDFSKAGIKVGGKYTNKSGSESAVGDCPIDPWGSPYLYISADDIIISNHNSNDIIDLPIYNATSFDIWSAGPNLITGLHTNRGISLEFGKFNPAHETNYYLSEDNIKVNDDDISNYSKRH